MLPEGMDELVPPDSLRLERMRRSLLDLFARWGYEIVTPPYIEYLESLLTGTGEDVSIGRKGDHIDVARHRYC